MPPITCYEIPGRADADETRALYFSSPAIFREWERLLRPPFEHARQAGTVDTTLAFHDLMAWTGRVIFSFIQFPVDNATLERLLDRFVLTALAPS